MHRWDQSSKLKLKNTLIVDHFEILGRGKSRSTSKGEGPRIPLDGTAETSLGLYSKTLQGVSGTSQWREDMSQLIPEEPIGRGENGQVT